MKYSYFSKNTAFTLIEIIVAVTILSFVMVSVFQTYSQILSLNRRLEAARILQEDARSITEMIAREVREQGIGFDCYKDPTILGCAGIPSLDYTGSGTPILLTKSACPTTSSTSPATATCYTQFSLMKDTPLVFGVPCLPGEMGCYLGKRSPDGGVTRISSPQVELSKLSFFISGVDARTFSNSEDHEGKVTLSATLQVAPRRGFDVSVINGMRIPLQTTISEKLYKSAQ